MKRSKMMLIRISQIALVIVATGLFYGCASERILTKEARAGINSVSINTEVKALKMCWKSKGGGYGGDLLLNSISLALKAATLPSKRREARTVLRLMRDNNIDPGRMITTQFKEQLETMQVFPTVVETNGDAIFTFWIREFGLLYDGRKPRSSALKPVLTVKVYLDKPDGTRIWSNLVMTGICAYDVDAYTYDEYLENPSLLRTGFEQATSQIVGYLMRNLEGIEPGYEWYEILLGTVVDAFASFLTPGPCP